MYSKAPYLLWTLAATAFGTAPPAGSQVSVGVEGWAENVIVPQSRTPVLRRGEAVVVTRVDAVVRIQEQVATTTLDISLRNPTPRRLEAELVAPVPDRSVVREFAYQGAAREPTARLVRAEEARRIYDSIVAKSRDPALLEFIGYSLIRTSVFPVEPNGTQKVRLTYEQILAAEGDRVDYVLPRTESVDYHVPWSITARVGTAGAISTIYSPSHNIRTVTGPGRRWARVELAADAFDQPGPFRLSYLREGRGVSATFMAYPDPKVGGGYFLMLAGLPGRASGAQAAIRREVILVLDRSGSMNGEKLQQVREAALQVIDGLNDGEAFNVLVYNEAVDAFSERPVIKTPETARAARRYLQTINPRGGTNIHDSLLEALRPEPTSGSLPMVLFLTDGLPTIGRTSESVIRQMALQGNRYKRRIFTFGVGVDVNTPLLENLAYRSRGLSTFVLPSENVELKVAGVFKRLSGPIFAEPELRAVDPQGVPAVIGCAFAPPAQMRVREVIPTQLPDMFEDDQLVVIGQYFGEDPIEMELRGNYLGREQSFRFTFDPRQASTRNAFVPRLWAGRKIAILIDAIRSYGADAHAARTPSNDPRIKELVDEIVRLSTEFGILSQYTAFLAREGTDISDRPAAAAAAGAYLERSAMRSRSGLDSVRQELNNIAAKSQKCINPTNKFYNARLEQESITTVQQVHDAALYRKAGRWVDSRLATREGSAKPDRVVEFGSPEFMSLAYRLAGEGRQGAIALRGDILLQVDGQAVLVKNPSAEP